MGSEQDHHHRSSHKDIVSSVARMDKFSCIRKESSPVTDHKHNYWRSRSNQGLFWAMNNLNNDVCQLTLICHLACYLVLLF